MGILNFIKRSFGFGGASPWLIPDSYATATKSGAKVSELSALSVTALWSCVKLISWTAASLPLIIYKRLPNGGKERAPENPISQLLQSPNPELSRFQWLSMTLLHQNLWGVGFSEIEFDRGTGDPVALWPIPPARVTPKRNDKKELYYQIRLDGGLTQDLKPSQCLVLPFLQMYSDDWLSPIAIHRETVGMSQALLDFGGKTFGQGTNPAGIVTHPGRLKETSEENLKKKFSPYQGLGNSHRLMLLEEGMKFERVGLPPEDAQYLETRKFTVAEIARIYNVPLHLLQDHEKSTSWGSGIEEQNLGFITFTMRPYFVQLEEEISRKLIDNALFFAEFLVDGLLRGRTKDRYSAYSIGRQWGWLSANDVRRMENMNPIPEGGDIYLTPMNMGPADQVEENIEGDTEETDDETETTTEEV